MEHHFADNKYIDLGQCIPCAGANSTGFFEANLAYVEFNKRRCMMGP